MKLKPLYFSLFLISATLFSNFSEAKSSDIYRLFDKDLKQIVVTIKVTDKKTIQVIGTNQNTGKVIDFEELLYPTKGKHLFFFNVDKFEEKKNKGFAIVEFLEDGKLIGLYMDTTFQNKKGVEDFLSVSVNTDKALAFYMIKDLTLDQANTLPPITSMSQAEVASLQTVKQKPLKLDEELMQQMIVAMKQAMWTNMKCLLLGYQFPKSKEEKEGLKEAMGK